MLFSLRRLIGIVCMGGAVALSAPGMAGAHDLARSESTLDVHGAVIEGWHLVDLIELGGADANGDGSVSYEEIDTALPVVYAKLKANLIVRGPEPPVRSEVRKYSMEDGHVLRLDMAYIFNGVVTRPEVVSTLSRVTRPQHIHFVSIRAGGHIQQAILDARQSTAVFSMEAPSHWQTSKRFLTLGIEHILTGYDHLAFLTSLVIGTTSAQSLVGIVTSFTIAHSITLALATFGLVALPGRLVESAIALSIAYVAFENLLKVRSMKRYRITFIFGLLHGFGFSNILRDMQLPRSELALSLFTFNAGVEIGQVAFVLAMYPLLTSIAASRWPRFRPAVSAAVLCVSVYWFVQRAFLG